MEHSCNRASVNSRDWAKLHNWAFWGKRDVRNELDGVSTLSGSQAGGEFSLEALCFLTFLCSLSSDLLLKWRRLSGNTDPSPRLLTWPARVLRDQQSIKRPFVFFWLFYPESKEKLSLARCTATPLIGTRICKNGNLSKTCRKILKANHKLTNFFHSFKGNSNWNLHVNFYEDPWGHP